MAYIALFRKAQSCEKYLSALRWAHTKLRRENTWYTDSVKQCIKGARKHQRHDAPETEFVYADWKLQERLVRHAFSALEFEQALAYILAGQFLLRVQDECVPLRWNELATHSKIEVSQVPGGPSSIVLSLKSRKNMPGGSKLIRKCLCSQTARHILCPVCALRDHFRRFGGESGRVFKQLTYSSFSKVLRDHVTQLRVPSAHAYTSKVFRRGSAMQLVKSGGSLAEVLTAGQWRSPAFLMYVAKSEVDECAVFQAMALADESSDVNVSTAQKRAKGSAPQKVRKIA